MTARHAKSEGEHLPRTKGVGMPGRSDAPRSAFLQENADFRVKLSAAKAALGFQRPIIGVHVR